MRFDPTVDKGVDESEIGYGARSWGDESVKGLVLIEGGFKWAPWSWTAYAVALRTFLPQCIIIWHKLRPIV